MVANQRSLLFAFQAWHCHWTERLLLAPQITIQTIDQLDTISLIGLLLLSSSTHRLRCYHQIVDPQRCELPMQPVATGSRFVTARDAPALTQLLADPTSKNLVAHFACHLDLPTILLQRHRYLPIMQIQPQFQHPFAILLYPCLIAPIFTPNLNLFILHKSRQLSS